MVGFPDSLTEQSSRRPQSQTSLINDIDTSLEQDKGKFQIPCVVVSDDELEKPRHLVILNENNIQIDQEATTKTDNNDIENEVNVVKKIAAGLKSPQDRQKSGSGGGGGVGGGGSLSSGSSIITIASDPDPPDPFGPGPKKNSKIDPRTEHWYHTTLQVSVPFFIAGIGTIGAGLVLSDVSQWPVFTAVTQLFILVPSLLGLKGNLDMCLAARLCTQANLGNMHNLREIIKMIVGNVALVQIQAIIAAVIVSVFAMLVGFITKHTFVWDHGLLLATSSICTATSSCFILDFVMIAVIMISHRCKMNPDNLATPLAASVGDVVSISVLSTVASAFYKKLDHEIWILYVVVSCYFLLLPFWIWIVLKNKYTRNVLTSGWVPVLSALFISGCGGLILDEVVNKYKGFVVFQPIINGIGGNLVSVQASRISTMLHQTSLMGILPPHSKMWVPPWKALFKGVPYAKTARILIGMAIPGHLLFIFIADYIRSKKSTLHIYFITSYLTVAVLQVMLLLYVAHIIIHAMWRYKIDPDNSAIPYLTSLGDLTGSLFLALAFWFLYSINKPYEHDCMKDVVFVDNK